MSEEWTVRNNMENKTTTLAKIIAALTIIQAAMIIASTLTKTYLDIYATETSVVGYILAIILSLVVIYLTVKDAKNNHISRTILLFIMQIVLIIVLVMGILKTIGIIF